MDNWWHNYSTTKHINMMCRKTCLVGLLIGSILRARKCTNASARVQFYTAKIERINKPTRYVLLWSGISFLYQQQHHEKCWWITNLSHKLQPEILPEIYVDIYHRHVLDRKQVCGYIFFFNCTCKFDSIHGCLYGYIKTANSVRDFVLVSIIKAQLKESSITLKT